MLGLALNLEILLPQPPSCCGTGDWIQRCFTIDLHSQFFLFYIWDRVKLNCQASLKLAILLPQPHESQGLQAHNHHTWLDKSLLLDKSFANIFSQYVALLFFILLTVSFMGQNFFILSKSNLSFLSFLGYAFGIISKNSSPNLDYPGFLLLFSGNIIFPHFTFRSVIHIKLIFMKGIRPVSRFFFFECGYPILLAALG